MPETAVLETTVIENAAWVVAWDAAGGGHTYLRGADVAFAGDTLVHVGPGYAGPAERRIDGANLFVLPGLIDVHAHPMSEPLSKGFSEAPATGAWVGAGSTMSCRPTAGTIALAPSQRARQAV